MDQETYRKESTELWERYFREVRREQQYDHRFCEFLDNIRTEEENKAPSVFQPWLGLFEDSIQWLANLWGILHREFENDSNKSKLFLSTWSLVTASLNHAISVRLLVISGLDNPARGAVRALDEYLCTSIAILNQPELAKGFQQAQAPDEASQFWYENFNTKKLRKHLNSVEKEFRLKGHISFEFREWREEELSVFSQTIHPTYMAGCMVAGLTSVKDENSAGIFGQLSASSERTLHYACKSIWYFSRFGFNIMFNEHKALKPLISFDKEDEMQQMVIIGRNVLNELNQKYWEHTVFFEVEES
jgi:hypothetical protein